jgi:uncharacterized membrane protein HdeD (DUF308 family)
MSRHYFALAVGVVMALTGFVRLREQGDEVYRVQQWTLVIAGLLVVLFGKLAARRPRNAGFAVILASMAALMSGLVALPFSDTSGAIPGAILGAAGMAAGIYTMTGTRMGDR